MRVFTLQVVAGLNGIGKRRENMVVDRIVVDWYLGKLWCELLMKYFSVFAIVKC